MDTNKETVPRFEGCNWDEPVVNVQRNGRETTLHRKVLTRGMKVKLKSTEVERLKSSKPFNSSTIPPFNRIGGAA